MVINYIYDRVRANNFATIIVTCMGIVYVQSSRYFHFPNTRMRLERSVLLTKTLLRQAFETDCSSSIGGLTPPKDYKRQVRSRIDRQYTAAPFYCRGAEKTCSCAQEKKKKKKASTSACRIWLAALLVAFF